MDFRLLGPLEATVDTRQLPLAGRKQRALLARLLLDVNRTVSTDRPAHDHDSRLPATDRARNELGWAPTISLDDGLAATVDDFRARLAG